VYIPGLAWSLCITPGPNQVLFVGSVEKVFKLDLSGKILGELGKLARVSGYFDCSSRCSAMQQV
jgi:hypothetical protein